MAARRNTGSGIRQVLQSVCLLLIIPLSAHGELSLATAGRQTIQHNQSSASVAAAGEGPSSRAVLSDDSAEREHLIGAWPAEREHLIGARLAAAKPLPLSAAGRRPGPGHAPLDFPEEEEEEEEPVWGEEEAGGPAGPGGGGVPARSDDIVTAEFASPSAPRVAEATPSSPLSPTTNRSPPPPSRPLRQRAGDPTATWTLSDFYDYLSPGDDGPSAADTTPEPEPTPSPRADMADENPLLPGSSSVAPPGNTPPTPPRPGRGRGRGQGRGGGCGPGLVMSEAGGCEAAAGACGGRTDFCLNGGACTMGPGGAGFCRCNVQDYMWVKGERCDWMVSEFQVLSLVVGVASAWLLLLFLIIVFFSKRLRLLSRENARLRTRSKHGPQSEPQTDGFSVSTVTDGSSHPNEDPQKAEDPVKAPPAKEEESLNIRNSHSPKLDNNLDNNRDSKLDNKLDNNRPASVVVDQHGHAPSNNTEAAAEVNSHQNNVM